MTGRTYRIGEAARLLKLEGYVLRFWETEFEQLQPLAYAERARLYSDADLVVLRRIRTLLHEQGMTIEGAARSRTGMRRVRRRKGPDKRGRHAPPCGKRTDGPAGIAGAAAS